jgi:hypothetical protein
VRAQRPAARHVIGFGPLWRLEGPVLRGAERPSRMIRELDPSVAGRSCPPTSIEERRAFPFPPS